MNHTNRKLPAIRIALTSRCNLNCSYCPPSGENFVNTDEPLGNKKLMDILKIFYEIGFSQFGFTGGEPLLNKDLVVMLKECSRFRGIFLKLYTNGTLLKDNINTLKRFNLVKLSLDTVDEKRYSDITGKNKLRDVLEGIELARKNRIKIRINAVLTQKNSDEIFGLIDFCCGKKVDLKILDLNCFDIPGYSAWKNLYISPSRISDVLNKKKPAKKIYTSGRYGIAMSEFHLNGISVRIKDTRGSSVYSPVCRMCRYFACQEGLYQLTLTCDGKLKLCKHRPDISSDLNHGKAGSVIKHKILRFLQDHYFSAKRFYGKKQVFLGHLGSQR